MKYYPIFVDLRNRPVVVVGGGPVAERKVLGLLSCGAKVTVISPEATPELESLAAREHISLHRRKYEEADCREAFLVIAGTDEVEVQQRIGKLINTVDEPRRCNFITPAIVQ